MKVLVDARDKLNIPWENPKNYDIGFQLLKFENTMVLDTRLFLHYVPALQSLWKDASIRRAFDRRREFQLVRLFHINKFHIKYYTYLYIYNFFKFCMPYLYMQFDIFRVILSSTSWIISTGLQEW